MIYNILTIYIYIYHIIKVTLLLDKNTKIFLIEFFYYLLHEKKREILTLFVNKIYYIF